MATNFNDGTVFTTAQQHGDVEIEYPLDEVGDSTARVIRRTMRVQRSSFSKTAQGTALAGYAGSRLVKETPLVPVSADVSEFTQIYATVPANRTLVFEGSSVFPFPSYQTVIYTPPSTAEAAQTQDNLWQYVETRSINNNPAPLYVDYTYFVQGATPTIPAIFKPTLNGGAVDFVSNGGSGAFSNSKALNGETFTASYSVSATNPSLATYAGYITAGTLLVIDVQVQRYMGDIFVMRTLKMKAQ